VVIGKSGKNISETNAMDYIGGYCLALDMTARDLQVGFILYCDLLSNPKVVTLSKFTVCYEIVLKIIL